MLRNEIEQKVAEYSVDKFGKVMLFRASADRGTIGEILDANYEVEALLEYKRSDIIGHYNTLIQPPMIARIHGSYMNRFMDRQDFRSLGIDCRLSVRNKTGYFVSCVMYVKFLCTLTYGTNFMAMFYPSFYHVSIHGRTLKVKHNPAVFLFEQDFKLAGINEVATEDFLIPLAIANQGSYSIQDMFAEVRENPSLLDDLQSENGCLLTVDLAKISESFGGNANKNATAGQTETENKYSKDLI